MKDIIPLKMPFTLNIDPTNYCNYKCVFCARHLPDFMKHAGKLCHMDMDLFDKIADELKTWGQIKSLKFYYIGEPFLNPNFLNMLEKAINFNISERIEITTNGTMLYPDISEKLVHVSKNYSGALYLRVSVSSIFQKKHFELTKSQIPVTRIRDNVLNLRKIRDSQKANNLFIYAKMIDTFSDENQDFINYYRNVADEAVVEEPMNWNGFEEHPLLNNLYSDKPDLKIKITRNLRKTCPYPFYTMAITSDGDVVCCCVDWNKQTKVGNVKEQSLKSIWLGERLKIFQELHLKGMRHLNSSCKNCETLFRCPKEDDIDTVSLLS
ncbi:MAG: SPASM domain-containing protein [Nitrospirae bacterium]|nr:SPASM domain-containing protein [Nitrospirota bacterium]MBF0533466.1 SPASM domain-containing protein [Nitrospirota bacterium]MBF0616010.1 SPASM domain-containing protein [Nitrospirota bacterium]